MFFVSFCPCLSLVDKAKIEYIIVIFTIHACLRVKNALKRYFKHCLEKNSFMMYMTWIWPGYIFLPDSSCYAKQICCCHILYWRNTHIGMHCSYHSDRIGLALHWIFWVTVSTFFPQCKNFRGMWLRSRQGKIMQLWETSRKRTFFYPPCFI